MEVVCLTDSGLIKKQAGGFGDGSGVVARGGSCDVELLVMHDRKCAGDGLIIDNERGYETETVAVG